MQTKQKLIVVVVVVVMLFKDKLFQVKEQFYGHLTIFVCNMKRGKCLTFSWKKQEKVKRFMVFVESKAATIFQLID